MKFFNRNINSLIVLSVLLFSCTDVYDNDYNPEFGDQKLVVYGNLEVGYAAEVTVSISSPSTKDTILFEKLNVENAEVYIFKSDVLLEMMNYDVTNQKYISSSKIEENSDYHILVKHQEWGEVMSEKVTTPRNITDLSISMAILDELTTECTIPMIDLLVDIKVDNILGDDIFMIDIFPKYDPPRFNSTGIIDSSFYNVCFNLVEYTRCDEFITKHCYDSSNFRLTKGVGPKVTDSFDNGIPSGLAYSMNITLKNFSESYRRFATSITQPDGVNEGFLDPQSTYTNIKNGYGVVYGVWERDTILTVVTP